MVGGMGRRERKREARRRMVICFPIYCFLILKHFDWFTSEKARPTNGDWFWNNECSKQMVEFGFLMDVFETQEDYYFFLILILIDFIFQSVESNN
jgi:hypothetical protein